MKIIISLDPEKLSNPNADLRYDLPDKIEELSDNRITDSGYDYDNKNIMYVFMESKNIEQEKIKNKISQAVKDMSIGEEASKILIEDLSGLPEEILDNFTED